MWLRVIEQNPCCYWQSIMEDNTENTDLWTDAAVSCLLAIWQKGFCTGKAGRNMFSCWKSMSAAAYVVTDVCIVNIATHEDRLVISAHTNPA